MITFIKKGASSTREIYWQADTPRQESTENKNNKKKPQKTRKKELPKKKKSLALPNWFGNPIFMNLVNLLGERQFA